MADDWHEGFPRVKGWYDCLVNGEQMKLYHFVCALNGKHRWVLPMGAYLNEPVLWRGEPSARQ